MDCEGVRGVCIFVVGGDLYLYARSSSDFSSENRGFEECDWWVIHEHAALSMFFLNEALGLWPRVREKQGVISIPHMLPFSCR